MLRRDFVRWAVSIGIAPRFLLGQQQTSTTPLPPPAPIPYTLGLNAKTPLPHTQVADNLAQTDQRFFTVLQLATLTRLCDLMLPPIADKPGAVEAETPIFLDFLLASSPANRRNVYTGGLNWLELEAHKKYTKPFAKLDDTEADAILKPWLRTWMNDHPPTELHAGFISIAQEDIRTATFNSKIWSDRVGSAASGLYWSPIEPDFDNAIPGVSAHVLAAPRSAHTMPSYPR